MSLMERMLKLYRVDAQVRGLRKRLDSAERYYKAQSNLLAEVEQRQEELRNRKKHIQARIGNLETEGATFDGQLEKFRGDLNSAVTNKQYSAVLTELNTVKVERSKLDDIILEEMSETEEIEKEIELVKELHAERAKIRDVAESQFKQRGEDVGARLAELETEREEAAVEVQGSAMAVFEEMADAYEGEAMATVDEVNRRHREYACGACNIHLPFEQVVSLMSPVTELVRCPACGRILYMQEELRGELTPK